MQACFFREPPRRRLQRRLVEVTIAILSRSMHADVHRASFILCDLWQEAVSKNSNSNTQHISKPPPGGLRRDPGTPCEPHASEKKDRTT